MLTMCLYCHQIKLSSCPTPTLYHWSQSLQQCPSLSSSLFPPSSPLSSSQSVFRSCLCSERGINYSARRVRSVQARASLCLYWVKYALFRTAGRKEERSFAYDEARTMRPCIEAQKEWNSSRQCGAHTHCLRTGMAFYRVWKLSLTPSSYSYAHCTIPHWQTLRCSYMPASYTDVQQLLNVFFLFIYLSSPA